mmetsp:Transcript_42544/g.136476  ORF Transcript_42544/g.136476 Transcript_42544/m.136476 type:complete len:244 (+) Transcript_42544:3257-3988(+)
MKGVPQPRDGGGDLVEQRGRGRDVVQLVAHHPVPVRATDWVLQVGHCTVQGARSVGPPGVGHVHRELVVRGGARPQRRGPLGEVRPRGAHLVPAVLSEGVVDTTAPIRVGEVDVVPKLVPGDAICAPQVQPCRMAKHPHRNQHSQREEHVGAALVVGTIALPLVFALAPPPRGDHLPEPVPGLGLILLALPPHLDVTSSRMRSKSTRAAGGFEDRLPRSEALGGRGRAPNVMPLLSPGLGATT